MTTHENHGRLWWDDRVEAHLDGSLAENESARFDRMLLTDDALSREVDIAREITDGLHSMPVVECPEHVTDAVMASVRKDLKENAWSYLGSSLRSIVLPRLRPALAMAVLLAVVVTTALLGGRRATPAPEVARALAEVKWTLAYLSDRTRQTGTTVRKEALEPLVVLRMQKAVDTFMEN